jgi:flagellin
MALNIISNYAANVAHRNLTASDTMATKSLSKLSSGTRVVSARDDAASMAIGARLNATTQALKTASVNVGQANSMLQIADGGMATIDDVLVRMKTLAVQASSGNLSDTERGFLNDEFVQLRDEIDRIASSTNFNGIQLLGDGGDIAIDYASSSNAAGLVPAVGFDKFTLTDNNYWAQDNDNNPATFAGFAISINEMDNGQVIATIRTEIDNVTDRYQSIDVTDYAETGGSRAINPGENAVLNFDEVGLAITVNTNFSAAIDFIQLGTAGANDFDAGGSNNFMGLGIDVSAGQGFRMHEDKGQQLSDTIEFQVGGGNTANDRLSINLSAVDSAVLGSSGLGQETLEDLGTNAINTAAGAQNAVEVVTRAIDDLQRARAAIGTSQNRLDFAAQNLASTQENTESARSTLLDLDVAAEMTSFTSKQILVQSGVAMLAQANQMPQNLLRLLQG